jgi:hypothetical protein
LHSLGSKEDGTDANGIGMFEEIRRIWPGRMAPVDARTGQAGSAKRMASVVAVAETGSPAATPAVATITAGTTAEKVMESFEDPEFRLAVEVLYHGARRAFFMRAHRWAIFFAILFGASAAATFAPIIFGLLAAAAAAADIAFDFVGCAQLHSDIRRRYVDLVAEFATDPGADFKGEWLKISADEPPLYRWVEKIAFRNACIALAREIPDELPFWRRMSANFIQG